MDDLTAYVLLAGVVLMWVFLTPTCYPDCGREEAAAGATKAPRAAE
jgi:hypothetical protein